MSLTIEDIETARLRIAPVVKPTMLMRNTTLSHLLEAEVFLKLENLQKTGSFKIRGAYNRIAALDPKQARRGVVAASAGNHGQALAYAATRAGVRATIAMPENATIAKVEATRGYGQTVVLSGVDYQAASQKAVELCEQSGATFVHSYDDPWVIAGQGTAALEILDEMVPDVVVVPVGGGGLIAGIAVALAAKAPRTKLIGVEAAGSPQLSLSLQRDRPSRVETQVDTIADGLATGRLGDLSFELIRNRLSAVATVDDFEIGEAVLLMLERAKLLTEGAGAAALAGALKLRAQLRGQRVVLLLSGGNIDISLLDRIIGHGLVKAGRLCRMTMDLADRAGELARLLALIGSLGANVRAIVHERNRRGIALRRSQVVLELETRGPAHIAEVRARLAEEGYRIAADDLA